MQYALSRPQIFDYIFLKPREEAWCYPDDFRARRSPSLNPLADAVAKWMEDGIIERDDIWEVTLELWAHVHGYIALALAISWACLRDPRWGLSGWSAAPHHAGTRSACLLCVLFFLDRPCRLRSDALRVVGGGLQNVELYEQGIASVSVQGISGSKI